MNSDWSIAIETSCRLGGVALGRGDALVESIAFDASARHTALLIARLDELLSARDLRPGELAEVYVAAGPGSFTGTRIGVTVARTLAQANPRMRCVSVHSPRATAENVRDRQWSHLGVVLDARHGNAYGALFARDEAGGIAPADRPRVATPGELLSAWPRPLLLIGEGLAHCEVPKADDVTAPPPDDPAHLPTPEGIWRVGRELAQAGHFTEYHQLLPIYARRPEAVRLWEQRGRS